MGLFSKILGETVDLARFIADDRQGNKLVAQVRREHDQWLRTAQLGVRYWTLAPVFAAADNVMADAYDVHGEYVFTGPAGFGMPNQLKTQGGTTSWRVWYQHGPLTTVPQQTAASWEAKHAKSHDAAMRRAAEAVEANALAELRRLYPASVGLLAGSR